MGYTVTAVQMKSGSADSKRRRIVGMAKTEKKLIANNKKAYHDYFLEERFEAGFELHGT